MQKQNDIVREATPDQKRTRKAWLVAQHVLLLIGGLIVIFPFIWMILTAFKTNPEATNIQEFRLLPKDWQWDNFTTLFSQHPMATYYRNSIIYTLLRSIPSIFFAALSGFALAKMPFRGRAMVWFLVLATLIVPFQVRLIPLADMIFGWGLRNEYWGVILPGLMEPFGIFLFAQACKSIPNSLLEAAKMDGCNVWQQFIYVVMPLLVPTLAAYAIIIFMWSWGEFLWGFIVVTTPDKMPLEVGIKGFAGEHYTSVVQMMAAATVAVMPVIAVFLAMQRQFIKGMTLSGLKG
jgi:multiple sugar transport system permease protein